MHLENKKTLLVISRWQNLTKGFSKICKDIYSTYVLQKEYNIIHYSWQRPTTMDDAPEEFDIITASAGADSKLLAFLEVIQPEAVLCIGDVFNIQIHNKILESWQGLKIAYIFIDGINIPVTWKNTLKHFDVIVSATDFGKKELSKAGYEERIKLNHIYNSYKQINPLEVINPPINKELYFPISEKLKKKGKLEKKFNDQDFIITNVSVNAVRKGIPYTLEYFKKLQIECKRRNLNIRPRLMLHTNLTRELENSIKYFDFDLYEDQEIQNAVFIPDKILEEKNIRNLYWISDIVLNTSTAEGWGLPLTEAMACGVQVLAPSHSGIIEAVTLKDNLYSILSQNEYLYNTEDIVVIKRPNIEDALLKTFKLIKSPTKKEHLIHRTNELDKYEIANQWLNLINNACNMKYKTGRITENIKLKIANPTFYYL